MTRVKLVLCIELKSRLQQPRDLQQKTWKVYFIVFLLFFFKELLLFPVKWIMSQKQNTEAELPGANENSVPPKVEPDHPTLLELAAK